MSAGPMLCVRRYHDELLAHSHDYPQLVFGLNGRLEFEVQGQAGCIARQAVMVVPAGNEARLATDLVSPALYTDWNPLPAVPALSRASPLLQVQHRFQHLW